MPVLKKSVALDENIVRDLEQAAQEEGRDFSPTLAEAIAKQLKIRAGLRGISEREAEFGPLTPEQKRAGREITDKLLAEAAELSR